MSQNHRYDSRHSYNPRSSEYQRDSNRSSYYKNSSYKEHQGHRSYHRNGDYQNDHQQRLKQERHHQGNNYRGGSYQKYSSGGNYQNRYQQRHNRYEHPQRGNQRQIDQRSYSRNYYAYRQQNKSGGHYEKRSRSRSRNRDHHGQYQHKRNVGYDNRSYQGKSQSDHHKYRQPMETTFQKDVEMVSLRKMERHHSEQLNNNKKSFNLKIDQANLHTNEISGLKDKKEGENYLQNDNKVSVKQQSKYSPRKESQNKQRRNQEPKNFISIEVKSRQKSPSSKDKNNREPLSSKSKSRSKSKRSKSKSRRQKDNSKKRHYKKHRSVSSSSQSSSYSSSSSSSSSRRSSSSSSRSSSSSYSQSKSSKRHKNKNYKDYYGHNSTQHKYSNQNNVNRENYDEKCHMKAQNSQSRYLVQNKSDLRRYDRNYGQITSIKSIKVEENSQNAQQKKDGYQKDSQIQFKKLPAQTQGQKHKNDNGDPKELQKQHFSHSDNLIIEPSNTYPKPYQDRSSYRRYQPYNNQYPRQQYNPNYRNVNQNPSRPYYNESHYSNLSQQNSTGVFQNQQVNQFSKSSTNINMNIPTYQNRTFSGQVNKVGFNGQNNDFQKRSGLNQPFRKPYVNNYQNYPPPNLANLNNDAPNQFNLTNNPYQQRSYQGFGFNRPNERNFYQNKNYDGQQVSYNPTNNYNNNTSSGFNNQNQLPYQPNFPSQIRRVYSEMAAERKNSQFPLVSQNKQTDPIKTQISKYETEKQNLFEIQLAQKRQTQLKKIKQLLPCSKTMELIQKAKQNLSIPAIKPNFLLLDLFKEMNEFKKQTMNPNLRSILQQDFDNKYNEQKCKVFENLRLLNLDEKQLNQSQQNQDQNTKNQKNPKQDQGKMEIQNVQNPQQPKRLKQFIWKKPEMSENLRQLKSNIQMLRKASSSLSELSRKTKIKEN